jgi:hypothetical protein
MTDFFLETESFSRIMIIESPDLIPCGLLWGFHKASVYQSNSKGRQPLKVNAENTMGSFTTGTLIHVS